MSAVRSFPLHDQKCCDLNLPLTILSDFTFHFVRGPLPLLSPVISSWEDMERTNQIFINYRTNQIFNYPISPTFYPSTNQSASFFQINFAWPTPMELGDRIYFDAPFSFISILNKHVMSRGGLNYSNVRERDIRSLKMEHISR